MLDQAAVLERRRQILRVVLLVMIFATLPFYCLGFFLWATAPDRSAREDVLPTMTFTPLGGLISSTPVPTLPLTFGTLPPALQPTPIQFNPPVILPPTQFIYPTNTQPFFIPTSTFAPTLTFAPTNTQPPPASPLPLPSNTPFPSSTVPPSQTPIPSATSLPASTDPPPGVILPPTDTPGP